MRECQLKLALIFGLWITALPAQVAIDQIAAGEPDPGDHSLITGPESIVTTEPAIEMGSVFPSQAPANQPTVITVTASLVDATLTSDSVIVHQVDASGNQIQPLGPMRDDGQDGDAVSGDRIVTRRVLVTIPSSGGGIQVCVAQPLTPLLVTETTTAAPPLVRKPTCKPPVLLPFPVPFPPIGLPGGPPLVIPTIKVVDVSFVDDIGITKDEVGKIEAIQDPVWRVAREGIEAKDEPAAYAGGGKINATIQVTLSPAPIEAIENATIEATVPGLGATLRKTGVTIPKGFASFTIQGIVAQAALARATKYWNKMNIAWTLSGQYGNANLSANMGESSHVMYVTLRAPIAVPPIQSANPVYLTALHLGVSKDGAKTDEDAFVNTWSFFSGKAVTNWKGQKLHYYEKSGLDTATKLRGLLKTGNGQCNTHAGLLAAAAAVNGVKADPIFATQGKDKDKIKGLYFLVKDFQFKAVVQGPRAPGWPYIMQFQNWPSMDQIKQTFGDATSLATLKGQNMSPPVEKVFNNHVFVKVGFGKGDPYYDPSYGVSYKDEATFQKDAIAGVLSATVKALNLRGKVQWRLREPDANGEFEFKPGFFEVK